MRNPFDAYDALLKQALMILLVALLLSSAVGYGLGVYQAYKLKVACDNAGGIYYTPTFMYSSECRMQVGRKILTFDPVKNNVLVPIRP